MFDSRDVMAKGRIFGVPRFLVLLLVAIIVLLLHLTLKINGSSVTLTQLAPSTSSSLKPARGKHAASASGNAKRKKWKNVNSGKPTVAIVTFTTHETSYTHLSLKNKHGTFI
jgi:hypothetical protein